MKWFVFFVFALLIGAGIRAMSVVNKLHKTAPQNRRAQEGVASQSPSPPSQPEPMMKSIAQDMEKCPRCAAYVVKGEVHCGRSGCPFPEKKRG